MKLLERVNNLKTLKENWKALSHLVECDQTTDIIDAQNEYTSKVENGLNFRSKEEHEKWLNVLSSYKFWEDFEELTNSIIQREENELNEFATEFHEFALRLAKIVDFETLHNAFTTVERDWLGDIGDFEKWWAKQSKEEKDAYIDQYKEYFGKDFNIKEIKKRYAAFEKCCIPNFFTNDEDGRYTLIDCIFERYCDNFEFDGLPFYFALISQMLNYNNLFDLLRTYRKAILEFDNDMSKNNSTKGSLDRLEYAQADIYDWVKENM